MADPGIDFANDLIKLLSDKWLAVDGGPKPDFTTQWNIKEVGRGKQKYSNVIIDADVDDGKIFSLKYSDSQGNDAWDFYHDISANIDIITSESEKRIGQLMFQIKKILMRNVTPIINTHKYIQLLAGPSIDLNEAYRGIFRKTMPVDCKRYNPIFGDTVIT